MTSMVLFNLKEFREEMGLTIEEVASIAERENRTIHLWQQNNRVPEDIFVKLEKYKDAVGRGWLAALDDEPLLEEKNSLIAEGDKLKPKTVIRLYHDRDFLDAIVWSETKNNPQTGMEFNLHPVIRNLIELIRIKCLNTISDRRKEAVLAAEDLKKINDTYKTDDKIYGKLSQRISIDNENFIIVNGLRDELRFSAVYDFLRLANDTPDCYPLLKAKLHWNRINTSAMCVADDHFISEHKMANLVAEDAYYHLCKLISKPKTDRRIKADNNVKSSLERLYGLKARINAKN